MRPSSWSCVVVALALGAGCADDGSGVCGTHDECPGGRCERGVCVGSDASEVLFPDAPVGGDIDSKVPETVADAPDSTDDDAVEAAVETVDDVEDVAEVDALAGETTDAADTAETADVASDSGVADDAPDDTPDVPDEEIVGIPCTAPGTWRYCPLDCAPGTFPMAQCVGTWGDCACHPVTRDHFADRGYALQAGLTATPDGRVLACYSVDQEIVVATRIEREVVDIFPVSLFDGGAGEDCDIEAGSGELVQLVYGEIDGADRRLVHHELDLDGNLGPASFPVTDINDNGHAPRLFVGAGGVEIVSAARFGAVGYLEHHRRAGGIWTPALVAQLPGPTVDQAVVRCGGESVVAYLALDTDRSTLEVAVGGPPTWDVAPVDQKDDRAGPGPSLACAGGQVHGIFQNTTESRLVELTSTAPALVGSYTATPIDVGHAVGLSTDLRIANDTLYVVYARTTGEVQVAARPLDGSSGWRTYSFAGPDDVEGSALAGDVGLAIDQDGLPVVLFFGVFGDGAGPWLATVDPSR